MRERIRFRSWLQRPATAGGQLAPVVAVQWSAAVILCASWMALS